jgi:hypothetical protein
MDKQNLIAFIIIVLFIAGIIFLAKYFEKDLKQNGVIVPTKILNVNSGGKTGGGFQCLIIYKGKSFDRPSGTSISRGRFDFVGKNFPGIYSPNTNSLKVLITPEDFAQFDISFPDSLNWVLPYINGK